MWFELEGEDPGPGQIRHGTRLASQRRVASRLRRVSSSLQLRAGMGHLVASMIPKNETGGLPTII